MAHAGRACPVLRRVCSDRAWPWLQPAGLGDECDLRQGHRRVCHPLSHPDFAEVVAHGHVLLHPRRCYGEPHHRWEEPWLSWLHGAVPRRSGPLHARCRDRGDRPENQWEDHEHWLCTLHTRAHPAQQHVCPGPAGDARGRVHQGPAQAFKVQVHLHDGGPKRLCQHVIRLPLEGLHDRNPLQLRPAPGLQGQRLSARWGERSA
mmetsp:Transcript_16966/g.48457  ORF Transcript_16966/g.48457 Transcript_16966/m.48457 type:complete len:204 (-) Transcript_16966:1295-1906(-)